MLFIKPICELLQVKGNTEENPPRILERGKGAQLSLRSPVQWTIEHQGILHQLIDTLTSPRVVAYPDFDLPFTVHTDASEQGLGAVLYQHQEGRLSHRLWFKDFVSGREELQVSLWKA